MGTGSPSKLIVRSGSLVISLMWRVCVVPAFFRLDTQVVLLNLGVEFVRLSLSQYDCKIICVAEAAWPGISIYKCYQFISELAQVLSLMMKCFPQLR